MREWIRGGGRLDEPQAHQKTHPWYLVIWLTGVDYFSTLGYQPGIALLAAGILSPIATAFLVAVTLACALPVYEQVARRSYAGQGSIALLENLFQGWAGKILVLVLLGFAATDFVITMTLSAADAVQHVIENPYLHPYTGDARMGLTIAMLAVLAGVFLKGFTEAIDLAAAVTLPYLALNVVVIVRAFVEVFQHPAVLPDWRAALAMRGDWTGVLIASALIFPRLALGLSGFETGVSVMPLIRGNDEEERPPAGRIHNTRKLLATAALIMSVMLVLSSLVTTLLISPEEYRIGGPAAGRAIAYLAHKLMGGAFGSLYDFSTILILWFAGASAMAGLLHLIPRYLPRFGMAPAWVGYGRPLVLVLFTVDVVVTLVFRADVEAQGGAYATGVLVLMLSAAFAAALALWKERARPASVYAWAVTLVFAYTLVDNVIERPDGIIIASIFIFIIVTLSATSRYHRATELRISGIHFVGEESARLWGEITDKKVHLVPLRGNNPRYRRRKQGEIQRHYRVHGPLAFIHVELLDNRSEFLAPVRIHVFRENGDYVIETSQAVAIANTIAYVSELIHPISIFLGLSRQNLMTQALRYFLMGEGETGLMVYTVLVRYWESTPIDDVRPFLYLMSD